MPISGVALSELTDGEVYDKVYGRVYDNIYDYGKVCGLKRGLRQDLRLRQGLRLRRGLRQGLLKSLQLVDGKVFGWTSRWTLSLCPGTEGSLITSCGQHCCGLWQRFPVTVASSKAELFSFLFLFSLRKSGSYS